jgi:glycosyltransferase involved in cell wall biosynthesis
VPVVTTRPAEDAEAIAYGVAAADGTALPPPLDVTPLPPLVDGTSARLVAAEDPAALAAALAAVLDDRALAAHLGAGGLEIAAAFGWQAIARRHVALYTRLIEAGLP